MTSSNPINGDAAKQAAIGVGFVAASVVAPWVILPAAAFLAFNGIVNLNKK
jgi:hypothetical protein